ncbi:MAG TPA: hypothetical protein VHA10_07765 [Hypericibacter adhaerens]|jgi:hypothetical protein|uniref:Uncharacterized protein n=1 Tax=Hypericibacter adhaerens TaxID=2602016 RepID=A0A5J6N5N2_9PROT|nr:hypothetical protein [Hypericibacter adhaerens]QEX23880.1 hypothetical protein FRZ61_38190 [Hypericibacter adhaerens]HWA43091.1 hypothetical protein [Hypericibacter adhaerens]
MIRVSALLPAFVVVFGMATAAFAGTPNANITTPDHGKDKAAQTAACGQAPRYLEPSYCGPNNGH